MHRDSGGASHTLIHHGCWQDKEDEGPSMEFDSVDDYTTQWLGMGRICQHNIWNKWAS